METCRAAADMPMEAVIPAVMRRGISVRITVLAGPAHMETQITTNKIRLAAKNCQAYYIGCYFAGKQFSNMF